MILNRKQNFLSAFANRLTHFRRFDDYYQVVGKDDFKMDVE